MVPNQNPRGGLAHPLRLSVCSQQKGWFVLDTHRATCFRVYGTLKKVFSCPLAFCSSFSSKSTEAQFQINPKRQRKVGESIHVKGEPAQMAPGLVGG